MSPPLGTQATSSTSATPSFEGEDYLEGLGLRQYWWHWHGHRTHLRVSDYRRIFDDLGLGQYTIRCLEPIEHSSHPTILPASAPLNQHAYEPEKHGPKPDLSFEAAIWRAQEIFVALRPIDPKAWARLTAPWGRYGWRGPYLRHLGAVIARRLGLR